MLERKKEVQKLIRQNQDKPANKQLNLRARYYQAGHGLDGAATLDMDALHQHYFNHPEEGNCMKKVIDRGTHVGEALAQPTSWHFRWWKYGA